MAKIGKNKKRCEKYRTSGHKQINKQKRQDKHTAKLQRFAEKKANSTGYVYSKDHATEKFNDAYKQTHVGGKYEGFTKQDVRSIVFGSNVNSGRSKHTPYAKKTSIMRKLDNFLNKVAAAEKAKDRKMALNS